MPIDLKTTPLAFIDVETTGMSARRGHVIEIGVVRIEDGQVVKTMKQLVDPGEPLSADITRITGITNNDVEAAPTFRQVAEDLADILDGAIFVAHNVRFDYSFIKAEFARLNVPFSPKLLCTVRLSRALYPQYAKHSLEEIIKRHGLVAEHRHRAYDDAHALWQLYQQMHKDFDAAQVQAAAAAQLRQPSLPPHLTKADIDKLPTGPGVYIFHGQEGPIYVGKSIHIKERVMSHFSNDVNQPKEMRITQQVRHIETIPTNGEFGALVLESQKIKQLRPIHNRQLVRHKLVTIAKRYRDANGYLRVAIMDTPEIDPEQINDILGVFATRYSAKSTLQGLENNFYLCPRLLNLEKAQGYCFRYQLNKCWGACGGDEAAEAYNARFEEAFARLKIDEWPYQHPIMIKEQPVADSGGSYYIIDNWCLIGEVRVNDFGEVEEQPLPKRFDRDLYKIIERYIRNPKNKQRLMPYSPSQN